MKVIIREQGTVMTLGAVCFSYKKPQARHLLLCESCRRLLPIPGGDCLHIGIKARFPGQKLALIGSDRLAYIGLDTSDGLLLVCRRGFPGSLILFFGYRA
ncbi:MAG TPA: hypothetical protein VK888_09990, partial [Anaerolineales bacterium]|nr:hypothetical protein [Anaerolineales bacterium]